ncbi:MAG: SIR2 family protein [Nitrospira sp.]|nr:SIR2 family protein [Nitrospira sp.]
MSTNENVKKNGYHFWIGGEDLFQKIETEEKDPRKQKQVLDEIKIRIGTLLKTDTVSLLLGAGASVDCGGQLIGSVPLAIEEALQSEGITGATRPRIQRWLPLFYLAVRYCGAADSPTTCEAILVRRKTLKCNNATPLAANFEQVLVQLHRWRTALPQEGECSLRVDGSPAIDAKAKDLDAAIQHATRSLAKACDLPVDDKKEGLNAYRMLIRKLLTRPLNLKRVNIFTLNYDTLVEQAADAEGVVLLDGFVGTLHRVFRPESYEQDLYFPADTTEGRVHRFDRVLHLYKLHGSITWRRTDLTIDNPYGVQSERFDPETSVPLLIYPTPAKYGETLGLPYSELFRRFATAVVRPQSVLFVIGYGFGDEHVNAIIRQALAVPSFTLVIVDPNPQSPFVKAIREQKDQRVWIAEGPKVGTFSGFADQILPDLQDEQIRQKVIATYRALSKGESSQEGENDGD